MTYYSLLNAVKFKIVIIFFIIKLNINLFFSYDELEK
jgi:hypothetical protein